MKQLWLCLFFVFVACSSSEKKFAQHLAQGTCEQAFETLPQNNAGVQLVSRTQQAGSTVVSYVFTGASYTAEVLWDITGGTIMLVALCGPSVAAMMATSVNLGNGSQAMCFPGRLDALSAPPLGRRAYRSSQSLRCPPLLPFSQSLRKVAACFENRNTPEDLKRASQSLIAISSSKDFFDCLPESERLAVETSLKTVQSKMGSAP